MNPYIVAIKVEMLKKIDGLGTYVTNLDHANVVKFYRRANFGLEWYFWSISTGERLGTLVLRGLQNGYCNDRLGLVLDTSYEQMYRNFSCCHHVLQPGRLYLPLGKEGCRWKSLWNCLWIQMQTRQTHANAIWSKQRTWYVTVLAWTLHSSLFLIKWHFAIVSLYIIFEIFCL